MPIKWQPFQEPRKNKDMSNSFEQEDWLPFMPMMKNEYPAIDIYQDKNNLYVEVSLVDINPKDVKVSIEDNILTLQGKKEEKKELKEKDYLRREISKGSFRRVIKLPVEVKGDKASAESSGGILRIIAPKVAKLGSNAKSIPIKIK